MSEQLEFNKPSANSVTSTASIPAPNVSDFMDYRVYLGAWFAWRKKQSEGDLRPYSYPVFAAGANIKSPNYLKMIIEGRRNLSDDMIGKFGKALGLNKEGTEEFRFLVHSTQASDPVERNVYLKKLSEMRVDRKLRSGEIDQKTWDKVPNWVAWVVYAMIDQEGARFDVPSLKRILRGKATEHEIEDAMNGLFASGEITRDEKTGEISKAHNLIDSPEDIPVALVRKLQAQLMLLGLESLHQDEPTEREFGTLTLSLTKSEFEEVKFKLRQMRKAIHKDNSIARNQGKGERVYQLNIQLFPVTNRSVGIDEMSAPSRIDLREILSGVRHTEASANSVDTLVSEAKNAASPFADASK